MTRNRASAKKAGTEFETLIVRFLSLWLRDDRIERRAKNGRNDRGDVAGVRTSRGARVVIEAKNVTTGLNLKTWMNEAEIEAGNDDSLYPVVIHKAHGEGRPEMQWVTMRLETFARLLEGGPEDQGEF
jgi:hypothetical protein